MGTSSSPVDPCLKVCVSGCDGTQNVPLPGCKVCLYTLEGATLITCCTTDASACCNPGITGKYAVTVTCEGTTYDVGQITIGVIGTTNITVTRCVSICVELCTATAVKCPVTLTVMCGGEQIYQGTLEAPGCVIVPVLAAASCVAYITDAPPGYMPDPNGSSLSSGGVTITLPFTLGGAAICCWNVPIPTNLTLSDGNGDHAFTWCPQTGQWTAGYNIAKPTVRCQGFPPSVPDDQIAIMYFGGCDPTVPFQFSVTRMWDVLDSGANQVYSPSMFTPGTPPTEGCGIIRHACEFTIGFNTVESGAGLPFQPCEAFAVSGALIPASNVGAIGDPVGGGVSIS